MKQGRAGYKGYRPRRTGTTRRRTRKGFRHHPWAIGGSFPSVGLDQVVLSLDLQYMGLKLNSRSHADHFQIFSEDRSAARAGSIVSSPQRFKFPSKVLTASATGEGNGLGEGPEERREKLKDFGRGKG